MKPQYHPVSLAVIRGSLEFVGFSIKRIRCVGPATESKPFADYRVMLSPIFGAATHDKTPLQIHDRAQNAFASDVSVINVEFDGYAWVLVLRSGISPDNEPDSALEWPSETKQQIEF